MKPYKVSGTDSNKMLTIRQRSTPSRINFYLLIHLAGEVEEQGSLPSRINFKGEAEVRLEGLV